MKDITKVEDELTYYEQYNAESELLKIIAGMNIDDALLDLKLKTYPAVKNQKLHLQDFYTPNLKLFC